MYKAASSEAAFFIHPTVEYLQILMQVGITSGNCRCKRFSLRGNI
jgi:hypothetical protein